MASTKLSNIVDMSSFSVKRYQPKLSRLMNLSEGNYMLLMRIIADCEEVGQQRVFAINETTDCMVEVTEVTRYTSVVDVKQYPHSLNSELSELIYPIMRVRLYHDARMVDILSSQGVRQIKPRYDYPNPDMHQPDEKQQMNQFLKEWLQLCLKMGYAKNNIKQA